jgi:hypothetical protein
VNAPTRDAAHWREQAACAVETADWWDLIGGDGPNADGTHTYANAAAIRICGACPVRRACLAEGIEMGDRGVIRGGLPLFKAHEWFSCETCGRRGARVIGSKGGAGRRRYCGPCRAEIRSVTGLANREKQMAAA